MRNILFILGIISTIFSFYLDHPIIKESTFIFSRDICALEELKKIQEGKNDIWGVDLCLLAKYGNRDVLQKYSSFKECGRDVHVDYKTIKVKLCGKRDKLLEHLYTISPEQEIEKISKRMETKINKWKQIAFWLGITIMAENYVYM